MQRSKLFIFHCSLLLIQHTIGSTVPLRFLSLEAKKVAAQNQRTNKDVIIFFFGSSRIIQELLEFFRNF